MDITKTTDGTAEKTKKTRKRRHHEGRRERPATETEQTESIITKNRITRNLGIYNKAKRSDTILRERNEKVTKKRIEEQMKKDLSRVLDVSSFRIDSLGASTESHKYRKLPSNILDIPTENSSTNSLQESVASSLSGSAGNNNQSHTHDGTKRLPFKIPLQEISENLIDSLQPANTFNGRNYFTEVREQILKVFRRSSGKKEIEKHECNSALQQRLNKRKDGEPRLKMDSTKISSVQQDSNNNSSQINIHIHPRDAQEHQQELIPVDNEYSYQYKQPSSNVMEKHSSDYDLLKQLHVSTHQMKLSTRREQNVLRSNLEQFQSYRAKRSQEIINHDKNCSKFILDQAASTFDILDFLDNTIQKTENQTACYFPGQNSQELVLDKQVLCPSPLKNVSSASSPIYRFENAKKKLTAEKKTFFPHQKDEDMKLFNKYFPEVSPLKKPSLKTPTPPKFYRRKMF